MNKFIEKIKKKRIVIIGPADYVNKEFNEEYGNFISGFDTVIRLNSMIKIPKKYEKYYGKKFDILYSSFYPFNDAKPFINGNLNKSRYLYLDSYEDISKNLILYDYTVCSHHKRFVLNKFKNFFKNNNNFEFITPNKKLHNYLKKKYKLKKNPTTGLSCILTCLEFNPSEIYVSGLTFYQDKKYNGYYDNYCKMNKEELDNLNKNKNYRFDGKNYRDNFKFDHDVNNEYNIFKLLMKNNKNIKIDKYLEKIFN